ncbi:MAG: YdcF family protein [Alphaproteobacteria bacterium]|nr:YdcF family protein [Alphaproteobacteria bacterium]
MAYVLGKVLWYLSAPGNLLVILLVAGYLALVAGARRTAHLLLLPVVVGSVTLAVLPIGDWLLAPLEDRFVVPVPAPDRADGIVVLGGALDSRLSAARGTAILTEHAERLTEAVVLSRRYPAARILLASGEAGLFPEGHPEAPAMRRFLVGLGVADDRIIEESLSRNTAENALRAKLLADPQPGEIWLLVTSAFHMPRAVGSFRRVGWSVVPWPVDHLTPGPTVDPGYDFNFRRGLARVHLALKEWIALVAYRLLDRTDTLFPAPSGTPA